MAMGSPASPRNVGAVQPPRAHRSPFTYSYPALQATSRPLVYHDISLSLSLSTTLLSFVLRSFAALSSRLPPLPPRYHFVCLSRGGPSRRRRAALLAYTLLGHPPCACIYRSRARTRPLSRSARDACRVASASSSSGSMSLLLDLALARDDRIRPDYNPCVFCELR